MFAPHATARSKLIPMPLAPGTKIGPYEITAQLGAGGMGEVYRARDPKLNREVAIKVLNAALANDASYLTRFQREAQVLASLNHPNIAAIYGLEQNAIVMELVEGPTLADRIAQGPIPLAEATTLAASIAEALEAAHEKGVVHRDLKPANVKITPSGTVKVLDFGLAKAADPAESFDTSNSPTMSIRATQAGVILGTAGYMSPEQAAGKTVDKRADIWSFGVVLWEMLSGRRMFAGETIAHTLAEVLTREADLDAVPATTPAAVKDLLRRCLDRNVKTRLRDIGEARILLQSNPTPAPAPKPAARPLPWILATAVAVIAAIALGVMHYREPIPELPAIEAEIPPPDKTTFQIGGGTTLAATGAPVLSPDGRRLVFSADSAGDSELWIRPTNSSTAQPLPGTAGATHPFWSPDSRYVGFFADDKLKKIDTQGGPPVTICDAPFARGGSWNRDGTILFSASIEKNPIRRVSASGGTPVPVEFDYKGAGSLRWPHFLPDGQHFLVSAQDNILVCSLGSKSSLKLLDARSNAIYVQGHLLFLRENTLMAQPFDPDKLVLRGEARPVAESVQSVGNQRMGVFSAAENGLLIFMHGIGRKVFRLEWVDREGRSIRKLTEVEAFSRVEYAISPDDKTLVLTQTPGRSSSTWLLDLQTAAKSHFRDIGGAYTWAADGKSLFFQVFLNGKWLIQRKSLGVEQELSIYSSAEPLALYSISPDGANLLLRLDTSIGCLPLSAGAKPIELLRVNGPGSPRLSPDGKWFAYNDQKGAVLRLFIRAFEAGCKSPGAAKQISANAGLGTIQWRKDGKELFFFAADRTIHSVELSSHGVEITAGPEKQVFGREPLDSQNFAASADGKSAIVVRSPGPQRREVLTLVQNWTAKLK